MTLISIRLGPPYQTHRVLQTSYITVIHGPRILNNLLRVGLTCCSWFLLFNQFLFFSLYGVVLLDVHTGCSALIDSMGPV